MRSYSEAQRLQLTNIVAPKGTCVHDRLIDPILTDYGIRTGKVRCLECGTVIDELYHVR